MTGFRSLSEFYDETTPPERTLIIESIQAYADEREQATGGGGAGGLPGGL